jgi:enoyl-CoA hydratase/carnithine racemase
MRGLGVETTLSLVDLDVPDLGLPDARAMLGCVVGVSKTGEVAQSGGARDWLERASFSITEAQVDDRRFVQVDSVPETVAELRDRVARRPLAATVCDDVLRAGAPHENTVQGLVTESLAYSTLQAGPEFARWLRGQGPRHQHSQDEPVLLDRNGSTLSIVFNRPDRHNAFSNALRAGLIDGLTVALADPSITAVHLGGNGRSFCSGGDLLEFGLLDNPADSHIARTRYSPALMLDAVCTRLQDSLVAHVHGAVLGSGLEMAAYCGRVSAQIGSVFGLPELDLGLLPGAGGTVSVARRIGRWRTAYLVLSGRRIDVDTALAWNLIDDIETSTAATHVAGQSDG